jgi:hypothetical protein
MGQFRHGLLDSENSQSFANGVSIGKKARMVNREACTQSVFEHARDVFPEVRVSVSDCVLALTANDEWKTLTPQANKIEVKTRSRMGLTP